MKINNEKQTAKLLVASKYPGAIGELYLKLTTKAIERCQNRLCLDIAIIFIRILC